MKRTTFTMIHGRRHPLLLLLFNLSKGFIPRQLIRRPWPHSPLSPAELDLFLRAPKVSPALSLFLPNDTQPFLRLPCHLPLPLLIIQLKARTKAPKNAPSPFDERHKYIPRPSTLYTRRKKCRQEDKEQDLEHNAYPAEEDELQDGRVRPAFFEVPELSALLAKGFFDARGAVENVGYEAGSVVRGKG